MSNTEHPGGAAHRSFRCTFGPVREVRQVVDADEERVDLVWPPPQEEVDAFSVIRLDGSDAQPLPAASEAAAPADAATPDAAAPGAAGVGTPAFVAPAPVVARLVEPRRSRTAPVQPIRFQSRDIKPTFGDCRAAGLAPRVGPLVVPLEPPPAQTAPGQTAKVQPAAAELAKAQPDARTVAAPPVALPQDTRVADVLVDDMMLAAEVPPLPISCAALAPDAETSSASRSAWLAVFFAAACALLTFVEYRGIATMSGDAAEAPPVPPQVSVADVPPPTRRAERAPASPKPVAAEPVAAAAPTRSVPAPTPTPKATPMPPAQSPIASLAVVTPKRAVEQAPRPAPPRVTPAPPRVTVDERDRGVVAGNAEPPATATRRPEQPPAVVARVDRPPASTPAPAPAPVPAAAAKPEVMAKAAGSPAVTPAPAPVPAVLSDRANDVADIQSTLARFRTAYSQLNASAARDVWPSVDARALERAFQSLKSQDLRFDSCTMTVTGARAQAACRGRTVYVPRIGDQSPRYTSREWNFELRKADERWTIASARSL